MTPSETTKYSYDTRRQEIYNSDDDDGNYNNDNDNDDGDNDEDAFARNETVTMECYDDAMIITTTMIMMAIMNMILHGMEQWRWNVFFSFNRNHPVNAALNDGQANLARSSSTLTHGAYFEPNEIP